MNQAEWASALAQAIEQREIKPAFASAIPDADERLAYQAQDSVIQGLSNLGSVTGFKSALTNEAARTSFGWHSPMSGVLLSGMSHDPATPVQRSDYNTGVIETEIGLRIGRKIEQPVSAAELPDFLAGALPMIELGDVAFDKAPTALDLIAGNAAASRYIAGEEKPLDGIDSIQVQLSRDDEALHVGHATDAMGSVLEAGTWLVNHCLVRGYEILPDQLLMTGSLGQIQIMSEGEYRADYGEFGSIEFSVVG